jgi:hypothetical protein
MSPVEPLLKENEVDDMLDVFGIQDAEVVRVDVSVPEQPRSGFMRKVVLPPPVPKPVVEDEIEELTDGVSEGWAEDEEEDEAGVA